MITNTKKSEKKARTAVRSADLEYETFKKRCERPGISKVEFDYTMKMAQSALDNANRVRRTHKRPPYGMSDEQWAEQRRVEKELRYRDRDGFRRREDGE